MERSLQLFNQPTVETTKYNGVNWINNYSNVFAGLNVSILILSVQRRPPIHRSATLSQPCTNGICAFI